MKLAYLSLLLLSPLPSALAADSGKPASACNDEGKIYKVCSDQEAAYKAALERAKKAKKKLLVVVGAEWCPWCVSLHKMFGAPETLAKDFSAKYDHVSIAAHQTTSKEKVPSGIAVLEKLKKQAKFEGQIAGIPVLALVDPKNGKTTLIDTEPLEENTATTKGHSHKKVLAAIETAAN